MSKFLRFGRKSNKHMTTTFPSKKSFERSSIETDIDFKFSKPTCPAAHKILILIKTSFNHFAIREATREGWMKQLRLFPKKFGVYFLVGHHDEATDLEVQKEQEKFGDIIMGDYQDTYHGVTLKVIMGMQFVYNYCKGAKYVVHLDDDTYFSPIRFMKIMWPKVEAQMKNPKAKIPGYTNNVHCSKLPYYHTHPMRKGRWKVDDKTWPGDYYPLYCSGLGWGMPIKVHRRTFEFTRKLDLQNISHLDDLILTGVIRAQNRFGLNAYPGIMWYENNKSLYTEDRLYARYKFGQYQDKDHQWKRKRREN